METRCPQCEKRLRLPDDYAHQRVRCRNCSTIFRPGEIQGSEPDQTSQAAPSGSFAAAGSASEPAAGERRQLPLPQRRQPVTREPQRSGGGAIGIAIVIGILLFGRAIPKVWDLLFERDRKPPPPAQLRDEDLRVLQEAIQQAEQLADEPPAGEALDPNRLPFDADVQLDELERRFAEDPAREPNP